jgi:hypothetical protein
MNSQPVHFLVELEIHEGKFDDFAAMAKTMTDGTTKEPGALAYEWFLSSDRRRCRLLETYANAEGGASAYGGRRRPGIGSEAADVRRHQPLRGVWRSR